MPERSISRVARLYSKMADADEHEAEEQGAGDAREDVLPNHSFVSVFVIVVYGNVLPCLGQFMQSICGLVQGPPSKQVRGR